VMACILASFDRAALNSVIIWHTTATALIMLSLEAGKSSAYGAR
jgi:hypothetical protein